jgi:hypothetical protein
VDWSTGSVESDDRKLWIGTTGRPTVKCSRAVPKRLTARRSNPRRNLKPLSVIAFGAAIVLAACSGGSGSESSAPPSFDSIKGALGRAGMTICHEVIDPRMTFSPLTGETDARSYYVEPCPDGGMVAVGSFPDEKSRDKGLQYLLGLDKASFTLDQSGPIWKHGWRLGTFGVVIADYTPPAATQQVDRAMTAVHGERVR